METLKEAIEERKEKFDINWEKINTIDDIKLILKSFEVKIYITNGIIPNNLIPLFEKNLLNKIEL